MFRNLGDLTALFTAFVADLGDLEKNWNEDNPGLGGVYMDYVANFGNVCRDYASTHDTSLGILEDFELSQENPSGKRVALLEFLKTGMKSSSLVGSTAGMSSPVAALSSLLASPLHHFSLHT